MQKKVLDSLFTECDFVSCDLSMQTYTLLALDPNNLLSEYYFRPGEYTSNSSILERDSTSIELLFTVVLVPILPNAKKILDCG